LLPFEICFFKINYLIIILLLKAPVSHPPLSQFNRTFHKTNWPPLH
jgi:hypothetical protein